MDSEEHLLVVLSNLKQCNKELQEEKDLLRRQTTNLENQLQEANSSVLREQTTTTRLRDELDMTKLDLELLKAERTSQQQEIEELKSVNENNELTIRRQNDQLKEVQDANDKLEFCNNRYKEMVCQIQQISYTDLEHEYEIVKSNGKKRRNVFMSIIANANKKLKKLQGITTEPKPSTSTSDDNGAVGFAVVLSARSKEEDQVSNLSVPNLFSIDDTKNKSTKSIYENLTDDESDTVIYLSEEEK